MAKRHKLNIQTPFIMAMKTVVDGIVGAIDLLPEHGNEKVSELLESIVATAFCCERETNKVDEWQEINRDIIADVYLSVSIDRVSERMDKNTILKRRYAILNEA
ncbi:MAG: hypothetical protein K5770_03060 [Lachnospiraceae bacterium]|nr:hypothetical protein [Lachnospiraceae bacterium]